MEAAAGVGLMRTDLVPTEAQRIEMWRRIRNQIEIEQLRRVAVRRLAERVGPRRVFP